jgi:uncharacterized SAM-binding protein YcdF (DUF218 family)
MIIDFLKFTLRPSSPLGLVLLFGAGVMWLYVRPASRGPRRYLLGVVLGYWLLATPIGANALTWGLGHGLTPLRSAEEARGADTVVVLGGGARTFDGGEAIVGVLSTPSILRAIEGARVAKLIGARLVIASGGRPVPELQRRPESDMLRETLILAGVPAALVIEESTSKTTREQARLLGPILRAHGVRQFLLVTSPTHMRRSLAVFASEGLTPIPAVSPARPIGLKRPAWLLPNGESLEMSDEAIYDTGAAMYYWWKGWTR